MNLPPRVNWETVLATTNRLPYSDKEVSSIIRFLEVEKRNGLIVSPATVMQEDCEKWFNEGLLALSCPQIYSDIVFVKCNNGTGIFGGQKSRFSNYIGSFCEDDFFVGNSFCSLIISLTGINNIFRAKGILVGGAF